MTTRPATLTLVLALGLLLAPALAAAQGAPPARAPPAQDGPKMPATASAAAATIRIEAPDRATAEIRQTWDGPSAKAMRQSLNVIFGNKDETLTQNELDNIGHATSADMMGKPAPFFTWDGQPALVSNATVTFEDGPGPTTSTQPISMVHKVDLALTSAPALPHRAVLLPLWDATFRLEWTDPWAASVTGNLDAPALAKGSLSTSVANAAPVTVLLDKDTGGPLQPAFPAGATSVPPLVDGAVPPVAPEESTAAQGPPARKIPGVSLIGALGALALAGLLAAGRRRKVS